VAGNDDAVRGEIKAPVALVIRWVAKKDTESGARGKLVGSCGREVRIASAPKRSKIMIGGKGAMEGEERGAHV
jgi:hypothetical protein